jgi:hypothetical protein
MAAPPALASGPPEPRPTGTPGESAREPPLPPPPPPPCAARGAADSRAPAPAPPPSTSLAAPPVAVSTGAALPPRPPPAPLRVSPPALPPADATAACRCFSRCRRWSSTCRTDAQRPRYHVATPAPALPAAQPVPAAPASKRPSSARPPPRRPAPSYPSPVYACFAYPGDAILASATSPAVVLALTALSSPSRERTHLEGLEQPLAHRPAHGRVQQAPRGVLDGQARSKRLALRQAGEARHLLKRQLRGGARGGGAGARGGRLRDTRQRGPSGRGGPARSGLCGAGRGGWALRQAPAYCLPTLRR